MTTQFTFSSDCSAEEFLAQGLSKLCAEYHKRFLGEQIKRGKAIAKAQREATKNENEKQTTIKTS